MSVCSFTPFSDSDTETVKSDIDRDETRKQIAVLLEEVSVMNKVVKEKSQQVSQLLRSLGDDRYQPIPRASILTEAARSEAAENLGDRSPSVIHAASTSE
jgi:hypothetical protein